MIIIFGVFSPWVEIPQAIFSLSNYSDALDIKEELSRHGYLKLWMPSKKNMEGLETIRTWIETGEVKEIIDRYLKEKG